MIDHIYLPVSDLKRSSEFYKKMLEPLGMRLIPLSQVRQYLGLADRIRNGAGFDSFGRS